MRLVEEFGTEPVVCFQVVQVVIGTLCVLFALLAVYLAPLVVYAPFGLGVVVRKHKPDHRYASFQTFKWFFCWSWVRLLEQQPKIMTLPPPCFAVT